MAPPRTGPRPCRTRSRLSQRRVAADQGLKRQVASGIFWVALGQIFGRGLGYVTTLILAKLVTPAEFGLDRHGDAGDQRARPSSRISGLSRR